MPVNRLIHEASPYLRQHAHNPVDWWPWGEAAWAEARRRDVPIFLSVGYSTCHWCHVMERESFENERVAEVLNRHFVAIKVDREERPDLDRVYMHFVQSSTGSGGWPMSVWLTPELKPFYGGTYFPPETRYGRPGFINLLEQIAAAWHARRDQIAAAATRIVGELAAHAAAQEEQAWERASVERAFRIFEQSYDRARGGFGGAPKFPRPVVLDFLLRRDAAAGDRPGREMVLATLRAMAAGGIHDHLGGGFHRYAVDERWHVPHFEKMLYDQAQLALSYLEAYQLTREAQYAAVAAGVFDYLLRDLAHPDGGFYSAEDADSAVSPDAPHQREGAYYVWTADEIRAVLGPAGAEPFLRAYGCREGGNVEQDPHGEFTGRNVLYLADAEAAAGLAQERAALFAARQRRPRPQRDDKIITAWNALAIGALARAARVLPEWASARAARYGEAARAAWRFVLRELYEPSTGQLYRRWCAGERAVRGFLDDYASLIHAHIELYETFQQDADLELAAGLAAAMLARFEDPHGGGLFNAEPSDELVLQLKDDYDGAEPAANSMAAYALARLGAYSGDARWSAAARRIVEAYAARLNREPHALPLMLCAALYDAAPRRQVVVQGRPGDELWAVAQSAFLPFATLHRNPRRAEFAALALTDAAPRAYVCDNYACLAPVATSAELACLLRG